MKLLAQGNTAEIFEYNHSKVCKLFYQGYPQAYIDHEFYNANLIEKLEIRTPRAYEILTISGRMGIIYDRIVGEELFKKIHTTDEVSLHMWLDKFTALHKQVLHHRVNEVISYKDFLKMLTTDQDILNRIDLLSDDDHLIHGDFHLGNVMADPSKDLVLIDMMNVCKGPILYDIARTYFLLKEPIRSKYLGRMEYTVESIAPYLDIILAVRENELKK